MIEVQATTRQFLGMSETRFMRDIWQQKPLLIRQALTGFANPLTPDDLGGLACEDYALSRLAIHDPVADTWTLRTGPFAESAFGELPPSHWTLLVQDVDKWDADVAALLEHFDFLPSWRIDDVMVSYAEDGGSVGAHVDQYDVFLLQGQGRRRWQISIDPEAPRAIREDAELKLLREFQPTHEWVLEPGDMLYLPPGIAHHGIAIGPCMTFSIGMRAPAVGEMVADFSGYLAERMSEDRRYSDAGMRPAQRAGEIDGAALEMIAKTLRESLAVDPTTLRSWFGSFITRYRSAHEALPRAKPLSTLEFGRRLKAGASLQMNPWSRLAWSRHGSDAILFVAGEQFPCPCDLAERICRREPISAAESIRLDFAAIELLRNLVNGGHFALGRTRSKP